MAPGDAVSRRSNKWHCPPHCPHDVHVTDAEIREICCHCGKHRRSKRIKVDDGHGPHSPLKVYYDKPGDVIQDWREPGYIPA